VGVVVVFISLSPGSVELAPDGHSLDRQSKFDLKE
jgi:hypothetical protein